MSRHDEWKAARDSDPSVRRAQRRLDRLDRKMHKAELQLGRAILAVNRRFRVRLAVSDGDPTHTEDTP